MNLTPRLTATGYQILNGGKVWIDQPGNPDLPGMPAYASPEAAEAAALAVIAELTAPPAVVEPEPGA